MIRSHLFVEGYTFSPGCIAEPQRQAGRANSLNKPTYHPHNFYSINRLQVPFKEFQCNFSDLWIFEITMPPTDDRIKRDGDAMRH